jgi:hypothetical protein
MAQSEAVFTINEAGFHEETQAPGGDVHKYMERLGRQMVLIARRLVPKKTHMLERSINSRVLNTGDGLILEVGSPLDYALMVHEGTRPHIIHPNQHRVLRFQDRGRIVYAKVVVHPGTRPHPYLRRAMEIEVVK